ncbi:MAG: low molecular weight phosphotyrosine protein phosphatase [Bdellovibrionales bacterium]|nr:low molecular weight phosphotyrosine protein phosphatase [Bdellovibrionales bacterium]
MKKVLFVCLGNICRSPTAHGVFEKKVQDRKLQSQLSCDSAGTASYHTGELPDPRSREHAQHRGYLLSSRARSFDPMKDFEDFDLILTMDESNKKNVLAHADTEEKQAKVRPFVEFCHNHLVREVPDPYYKGDAGFEEVLDIIEDGCENLISHLLTMSKA